jgi:hypothetical protein
MRPLQGTYVVNNCKEIGVLQWWWQWRWCRYNNSIDEARARGQWRQTSTDKARVMQQWHHNRSDKEEGKWLGEDTRQ